MRISAVVPAYNEENTIAGVINVLKDIKIINEIIVVSDGSRDGTAGVAKSCGAHVIELPDNMGKGAAVKAGLENSSGEIVLLMDADLVGLKRKHVEMLVKPVMDGIADMTVGLFTSGRFSTDLAQKIAPQLSGQRAVRRSVLLGLTNIEATGYGIEVALTRYADVENLRVQEVELEDLTHITKEEKLGFIRGFSQRLRMYWQIYRGFLMVRR